jgi:acetoin utilization deacetylase AcuC-like enzyme
MINQIKEYSKTGETSWIDLDTYICPGDYETARLAAGGVLQACKQVLYAEAENAYALVRPPGHHATRERSMGFCLFNNAAIAAYETAKQGKKILIMDFDIHHGNGTQDIFYDRKDVMYQSFHLSPHYPGTGDIVEVGEGVGKGYTINAPLSYGNGVKSATKILDEIFLPIAKQFKPDLIIFSAGYDSHHQDPLGGLRLTTDFYAELVKKYQDIQSKMVFTPEGGYNLNWIGKCLVSQIAQLSGNSINFNDDVEENENMGQTFIKLKDEIGKYWKI